jgi:hypothetical protein
MPIAGWYTWKGPCIEGSGVSPHIAADIDVSALASGADPQMDKALEVAAGL